MSLRRSQRGRRESKTPTGCDSRSLTDSRARQISCAQVEEKEDGLVITGVPALHGGAVETQNDHRLAMSAATAACAATGEITVDNDGCVAKSYPRFWEDFGSLKGEGL